MRRWWALALLLAWAPLAHAETLVVQSTERLTADEAASVAVELRAAGLEVRTFRKFEAGAGWTQVVEVHGLGDMAEARDAARRLAVAGLGSRILEGEGEDQRPVGQVATTARPAATAPVAPDVEDVLPPEDPEKLRRSLARANETGWSRLARGDVPVFFEFERRLQLDEGPLHVRHRYYRQGEARRLEVTVLEGAGQDSLTVITPGNTAWLVVEGVVSPREVARARSMVDRFSPEAVWGVPLSLSERAVAEGEWDGLALAPSEAGTLVLERDAPRGLRQVTMDADDHVVSTIVWSTSEGLRRWELSEPEALGEELRLPRSLEIHLDDAQVETLELLQLDVAGALPEGAFSQPQQSVQNAE